MTFVLSAVSRAFLESKPQIFNSDQGSQFTNPKYIDILKDAKVEISMDGKGRAIDNVFTERLWRSLKYEEVYLKDYADYAAPKETRAGIADYIWLYNNDIFRWFDQSVPVSRMLEMEREDVDHPYTTLPTAIACRCF